MTEKTDRFCSHPSQLVTLLDNTRIGRFVAASALRASSLSCPFCVTKPCMLRSRKQSSTATVSVVSVKKGSCVAS